MQTNPAPGDQAQTLHERAIVIDALDVSIMNRQHFQNMSRGGITAANVTLTLEHSFHDTVELICAFDRKFHEHGDLIRPVRSVADIHAAKTEGKVGIIYGMQNATAVEGDLRLLPVLHALGVRIIQLTYMTANLLGDGCLEPRNGGLTVFGRAAIREMNRLGMLIDLSHCGDRTSLEAVETSEFPVAFTHACAIRLCKHPRNKTDEAMRALAVKGGVMGITPLAAFVADDWRNANLSQYLDQIDYAINLLGIDHVGLGMDFIEFQPREIVYPTKWGGVHLPTGDADVAEWPILYARDADHPTKLANITEGLLRRGYSESQVGKVLGGNFLRLFNQVWSIATAQ
jgi:membrane dipeptidase